MKFEHGSHPFRVSASQVIINRHDVNAFPGKGVEIYRKRRYECFSLTRSHLCYFTLVKYDSTNELNVVMDHVPLHGYPSGCPFVEIDSLLALNRHFITPRSQVAVEVCGGHLYAFMLLES